MTTVQLPDMKYNFSYAALLATAIAASSTIASPIASGRGTDQEQKPESRLEQKQKQDQHQDHRHNDHQHNDAAAGAVGKTPGTIVSTDEHAFGREGNPYKVTRTVNIVMDDRMRFTPASVTVKQGDTIRFIVHNKGKLMHEMVLGTMERLKAHGIMMKKDPGMEHDEPYMAHVQPGGRNEIVWQFTNAGEFHYACLIPGHFEAGMTGNIKVTKG
jgi:uncharacterized cupredoxin-like copper-binding protein